MSITLYQKAEEILVERRKSYQGVANVHYRVAQLWSGFLGIKISQSDVLDMMSLFKKARRKVDHDDPARLEEHLADELNYLVMIDPRTDKDLDKNN